MKHDDLLKEAKEKYKHAVDGWNDIYKEAEEDIKFTYNIDDGQWPDAVLRERKGRPTITINKLLKFVRQLRGERRINKPRIKVLPVDDKSDPQTAKIYEGIIRQIEYQSNAEVAYDTAYMNAVACGVGFFRLVTDYIDDVSFDQEIFIRRIPNPFSVHFDPSAQEFTLEDAEFCFVEDWIDKEQFELMYPDAMPSDYEGAAKDSTWYEENKVKVCEYFWKEKTKKRLARLDSGEIVILDRATKDYIRQFGRKIVRERDAYTTTVMWAKLSGDEVLEGPLPWPGKYIPVIPVFGDEVWLNGKRYLLSLIRGAKDIQRAYNYWASMAVEHVALSPKSPYIVAAKQIAGFEREWNEAHIKNRMFLRYNPVPGLAAPRREPQMQIPQAIVAMMQTTAFDLEDQLGRYASAKGMPSNERSAVAIQTRITQSDKTVFTFIDNFSRAIIYAGKQLIDLIPKIYDNERVMKIMGEDGTIEPVKVNTYDELGNPVNHLNAGRYDLIATVGPSYASRRQEAVDMLIQAMQYAPALAPIIAPFIFKYADWEGAQEIAEELKKYMGQIPQEVAGSGKKPTAEDLSMMLGGAESAQGA